MEYGIPWEAKKKYVVYGRNYPNLYAKENGSGIDTEEVKTDGIGRSDSYYTEVTTESSSDASTLLTVTQTNYYRTMDSSHYDSTSFYNLIMKGSMYWLASRSVSAYEISPDGSGGAYFNICGGGEIYGYSMYSSVGLSGHDSNPIRPLVSFNHNTRLSEGDGSEENPYQIAR